MEGGDGAEPQHRLASRNIKTHGRLWLIMAKGVTTRAIGGRNPRSVLNPLQMRGARRRLFRGPVGSANFIPYTKPEPRSSLLQLVGMQPGYLVSADTTLRWNYLCPGSNMASFIRLFVGVFIRHGCLRALLRSINTANLKSPIAPHPGGGRSVLVSPIQIRVARNNSRRRRVTSLKQTEPVSRSRKLLQGGLQICRRPGWVSKSCRTISVRPIR